MDLTSRGDKKFIYSRTILNDVFIIKPKVYGDERGWFMESFNEVSFEQGIGPNVNFVQDNHSLSRKFTLRGLHYQIINPQGKLVRVISGAILDVVVDLRQRSSTFGKWFGVELSAENALQLWVPAGFAHGFITLTSSAETLYKVTSYYDPTSEVSLLWSDPTINIDWNIPRGASVIISDKDRFGLPWDQAPKF